MKPLIPQIPPPPSESAPKSVQIPSTQILPNLLPELKIGDVLRMMVRANPPQGLGTLYVMGQLLSAQLPKNVETGDRILAKLTDSGEQVTFRILEVIKKGQQGAEETTRARSPEQRLLLLSTQLENLLKPQTREREAFQPLPVALPQAESVQLEPILQKLDTLLKQLPSETDMASRAKLENNFMALARGDITSLYKNIAQALKQSLEQYVPPPQERFLLFLRDELSKLSLAKELSPQLFLESVERLAQVLDKEIRSEAKLPVSKERQAHFDLLKVVLYQLKLAREEPANREQLVEQALDRVLKSPAFENPNARAPQISTMKDLQTLFQRFEQMSQTQEYLQRLNPILQALGEPALLLFPSILNGLMSHTEVYIDPDAHRRNQAKSESDGGGNAESEEEKNKGATAAPLRRVQVRVPLANLGQVEVDIIHQEKDVEILFTLGSEEGREHLSVNLAELSQALAQQQLTLENVAFKVVQNSGPISVLPKTEPVKIA